jgi:hypothetical protein
MFQQLQFEVLENGQKRSQTREAKAGRKQFQNWYTRSEAGSRVETV